MNETLTVFNKTTEALTQTTKSLQATQNLSHLKKPLPTHFVPGLLPPELFLHVPSLSMYTLYSTDISHDQINKCGGHSFSGRFSGLW